MLVHRSSHAREKVARGGADGGLVVHEREGGGLGHHELWGRFRGNPGIEPYVSHKIVHTADMSRQSVHASTLEDMVDACHRPELSRAPVTRKTRIRTRIDHLTAFFTVSFSTPVPITVAEQRSVSSRARLDRRSLHSDRASRPLRLPSARRSRRRLPLGAARLVSVRRDPGEPSVRRLRCRAPLSEVRRLPRVSEVRL